MAEATSTGSKGLTGPTNPAARKVAGGRRNPSVYGVEHTAPHWLRVMAGVSWRLRARRG